MSGLGLYFKYISMNIRSQMSYKMSFIFMSVGNFAVTFIEFIGLYALFQRFGNIKGWTLYEAMVFYGVINCSFAISEAFGRGYDLFPNHVRMGTFDRILLRPRGIMLQILGTEFQMMRIGRLLQGVFIMIWGISHLKISLGVYQAVLLLFALIGGAAFFTGLFILQATLSFWSVQSLEIVNSFTYGGVQTAQYPLDIYKKWFQKIFIYVIPIGCVSYYPMVGFLRGEDLVLAIIAPVVGIIFYLAALFLFRFGMKFYCSTGS